MRAKLAVGLLSTFVIVAGATSLAESAEARVMRRSSCPAGTTCPAKRGCVFENISCETGVSGEVWVTCNYRCGG